MRLRQYEEQRDAMRREIIAMYESGETIDFDDEKWWGPLLEEFHKRKELSKAKYPYVLFRRILWDMRDKVRYPMPSLFELRCGVAHGNEGKIENYVRKGMAVEEWFFPTRQDISHILDSEAEVKHLHSWQRLLSQKVAPWAKLEAYLHMKKGDQQKSFELHERVKRLESQNAALEAKYQAKLQELSDVSNTDKGKSRGKRASKQAVGPISNDNSERSVTSEDGPAAQSEA